MTYLIIDLVPRNCSTLEAWNIFIIFWYLGARIQLNSTCWPFDITIRLTKPIVKFACLAPNITAGSIINANRSSPLSSNIRLKRKFLQLHSYVWLPKLERELLVAWSNHSKEPEWSLRLRPAIFAYTFIPAFLAPPLAFYIFLSISLSLLLSLPFSLLCLWLCYSLRCDA